MRTIAIALTLSTAVLAVPAVAHPEEGDYRPRGPSTSELAEQAIGKLVAQKKLDASWTSAKLVSFDYRSKDGVAQYVLTYENPSMKQTAKRKLFVLMSSSGEFISAGHKLT